MLFFKKRRLCIFACACAVIASGVCHAEPPVNLHKNLYENLYGHPDAPVIVREHAPPRPIPPQPDDRYRLGPGDVLQITVYGEDELSGIYRMGPDGIIAMPLIGTIEASDLQVSTLEREIKARLADGYLRNPSVSIDLTELRPFFIMGEVRTPGSYPYMGDMSVLNAVAVAGGFTYRADRKDVKLLRPKPGRQQAAPEDYETVPVGEKLLPGDVIVVEERFF